MQVIITEDQEDRKITVTEWLDPTSTSYTITQGNNEISLDNYQLKELISTLQFLQKRYGDY